MKKYKPSGKASVVGILTALFLGIVGAIFTSLLYIVINKIIPNIWFAAITAGFFGFLVGSAVNFGIKLGKIRNMKIALLLAVFSGLFAIYMQWVIFDVLILSEKGFTFNLNSEDIEILFKDFILVFTHPNILINDIIVLNQYGTFSIESGNPISGILLWAVWFGEFLVIIIPAIFIVKNGVVSEPFSEVEDKWMEKRNDSIVISYVPDKDKLIREFDSNNFEVLNRRISKYDSETYAEVIVYELPKESLQYITINNIVITKNKSKKEKVTKIPVIKKYPILKTTFQI